MNAAAAPPRAPNRLLTLVRELLVASAGILLATQVVARARLDGPWGQRIGALALAACVYLCGPRLPALVAGRMRRTGPGCGTLLLRLPGALVLGPVMLWVAGELCRGAGLELRISGFWPLLVAAVVLVAAESYLGTLIRVGTRDGREEGAAGPVVLTLAAALGLWLAALALPGARLADGPWWRQLLTLLVLGWLFALNPKVPVPFLRILTSRSGPFLFVVGVCVNALVLWAVTWFSTGLRLPMHIGGVGGFLLAALLVTALMWVANLPAALPLWRSGGPLVLLTVTIGRFGFETLPSGWSGAPAPELDLAALLNSASAARGTPRRDADPRVVEGEVVDGTDGPPAPN
jgi:uncharacterized membrane protein YvlD (DUF360 family)